MIKEVFLAYYHDGFCDDWPVLLGVFESPFAAQQFCDRDKVTRDRSGEYRNEARWYTQMHPLLTGHIAPADCGETNSGRG